MTVGLFDMGVLCRPVRVPATLLLQGWLRREWLSSTHLVVFVMVSTMSSF